MTRTITLSFIAFCITLAAGVAQIPPRKFKRIQKFIDKATNKKLTGVVVYIRDSHGDKWTGTSGYSNLENKISLHPDHVFALASIGKMYNAVAVMKLVDEGRIQLDDKITRYLPGEITAQLPSAENVSVRHLLGHTSGFVNYEFDPSLVDSYMSGQLKLDTMPHGSILKKYVFGKQSLNAPGTEFHYSSTNYLLLAMVVDHVVPGGHAEYLRALLKQQGLLCTTYRQTPTTNNVSYYGDPNMDGNPDNLTDKTFETTNWFMGDDGVYAPIAEAALFIERVMDGHVLSAASLASMKHGNTVKGDTGLGLITDQSFPYGLLYGHGGRGIGVTTDLYYFPRQKITIAIFCNNGLRAASPDFRKVYIKMRSSIVRKIFLF